MTKTGPPHFIRRRYRLAEWLGRGSFGPAYRAQDEALDRPVVIKFVEPEGPAPPEGEASFLGNNSRASNGAQPDRDALFLQEARLAAQISHPNIAAIVDLGQEQGWDYLVIEYIPGNDLRGLLKQRGGQLPPGEGVAIAVSVLQALACAHEQGLLHRNLKPENIFLTPAGQVKVTDFNLSGGLFDLDRVQAGTPFQTMFYQAPEILHERNSGAPADLYSLGVVLYELLTSCLPFRGETLAALLNKILYGACQPPRTLNPEVPLALEQFILRLLSANPGLRFSTAREALSALTDIQAAEAVTSGDETQAGKAFLLVGASTDIAAAMEADRCQLAGEVHERIIEPLNLLLAQAAAFEHTLPGQPSTRMAVSVLSSLARQVLQRARDLEAGLHPALLETLGLESAFEALAGQYERAYALRLSLDLARLAQRPPPGVELELFRLTQEVLEILRSQRIAQAGLQLKPEGDRLRLEITFAAAAFLSEQVLTAMRQRIEPLGGSLAIGRTSQAQTRLSVCIPLRRDMHFTRRERQVLDGLVLGKSNKQIAAQLAVSPRTINYHLDNIYTKLGVRTRTEAAVIALRQDWARRPPQASDPVDDPG